MFKIWEKWTKDECGKRNFALLALYFLSQKSFIFSLYFLENMFERLCNKKSSQKHFSFFNERHFRFKMTRISAVTEAKYLTSRKHKDESSRGWPFDRRRPKKMQLSHHNNNCKTRLNSTVKLLSAVSKISHDARQCALKAKNMKKSRALLSIIRFLSTSQRALLPVMKLCYFIVGKAVSQVLSPAWSWEKKHAQQLTFSEIEFIIDKEIFL